ncbi:MAG TPA: hypothetical protein VG028_11225 [Terriglobia bacterium]|nr:hypothetical protein [Terriglobia bacterium]
MKVTSRSLKGLVSPLMLGVIRLFLSKYKAVKLADKIAQLLLPAFVLFLGSDGKLDHRMQTDEFVLSYMYGAFALQVEDSGVTDTMQRGFTMWECFDRFFPGEGRKVLELCNVRLEAGQREFKRGMGKGYKEMADVLEVFAKVPNGASEAEATKRVEDSGVDIGLPSLRKHLVHNYS